MNALPKHLVGGIPREVLSQHIIALGKTRSGKSSKLRVLAETLLTHQLPTCIIDPKGDWWGLKSSADGKRAGFPVVIFGGEHADVPLNEHAGAAVAELVATGNRPCIIDLGGWMPGARTRFFIAFASTLFRMVRGKLYLVIDEVHNFAPQGKVQDVDAGKMLHWANRLASEGSGKGITLLAASQRPQKVHKDFVTSCETLIACRVNHKLDRTAIGDWIDGCADPALAGEVMRDLADMKRTDAWVWSPEIEFGPKRFTWPMFATYDSFKPREHGDEQQLKGWAAVDLDQLKTQFSEAFEEAQANDPKELRAKIAALENELRTARVAPAAAPEVDLSEFVPRELVMPELERLQRELKRRDDFLTDIASVLSSWRVDDGAPVIDFSPVIAHKATPPTRAETKRLGTAIQLMPTHPPQWGDGNVARAPAEGLTNPQQEILDALRWFEKHGNHTPAKAALAARAGVSGKSSGYANNLGALRSRGLIEYPPSHPGTAQLTAQGRALARYVDDGRPLLDHWCDVVDAPLQDILRALARVHPRALTKEKLAEMVDKSATSSGFANNLGKLRSFTAIDYPVPGEVKLTANVMP